MLSSELKHRIDGGGKFKLQWNWVPDRNNPDQYHYNYWATYDSRADAEEFYERYVKDAWPDVKWEIIEVNK